MTKKDLSQLEKIFRVNLEEYLKNVYLDNDRLSQYYKGKISTVLFFISIQNYDLKPFKDIYNTFTPSKSFNDFWIEICKLD